MPPKDRESPGQTTSSVEVVKALYEAFARKDVDQLRRLLDPQVEWIQCSGFPGGGRRQGAEQVIEKVFSGLHSQWNNFQAPVEQFLDAGDHVVVLGHYEGTHAQTQCSMHAVFAHVYEVCRGKIVKYRQYADTWPMVAASRGENL